MLRLTQLRLSAGLNKARLARKADIDNSELAKIEAGRIVPYPKELARLAAALGLPSEQANSLLDKVDDGGAAWGES